MPSRSASATCRATGRVVEAPIEREARADSAAPGVAICCGSSPHYAPELEEWERDIFLAVREESFYFYPVFACQIMNEGWASYWHARLLREADFLPHNEYLDALKTPLGRRAAARGRATGVAGHESVSPRLLDLGVIVDEHGLERAFARFAPKTTTSASSAII